MRFEDESAHLGTAGMAGKTLGVDDGFNSIVVRSFTVRGDLSPADAGSSKERCNQCKQRRSRLEGLSNSWVLNRQQVDHLGENILATISD